MVNVGQLNSLVVLEASPHGLYLDGGEDGKILLPNAYVEASMRVGDRIRVFIYNDSEDRLIATTAKPLAMVGDIAALPVVDVHDRIGVFLDWGLPKDLLLPYRELGNQTFRPGDVAVVAVVYDERSGRVIASARLHRYLSSEKPTYERNAPVEVLIYAASPLGYKAIVDKRHQGLFFHSETSAPLRPGDRFTGYVKEVHPDGKIDLLRDPAGYGRVEGVAQTILRKLEVSGGTLPFNDRTPPEDIRHTFNTSKKAFKQALGSLLKQGEIRFTESGIEKT